MPMIRKARKPRRTIVIKRWKDEKGTTFTISQRPNGEYEAQALSKDEKDYNVAIGATPKAALKHLGTPDAEYPAADRDPLWQRA